MKQGNHGYSAGSEAISTMTPSFDYYYQNPYGSRFLVQIRAYYGPLPWSTMVDPCLCQSSLTMVDHGQP